LEVAYHQAIRWPPSALPQIISAAHPNHKFPTTHGDGGFRLVFPDALTLVHVRYVALLLGTKVEKEIREACANFLKQVPVVRRQKHAAQQNAAQQHEDKILQLRMASPKNNKI
jgi:hypothetical protein